MAGELCGAGCGYCGRCDPNWDDPALLDRLLADHVRIDDDEAAQRARNEAVYVQAIRAWFAKTEARIR